MKSGSILLALAIPAILIPSPARAREILITPDPITSSTSETDLYPAVNLRNGTGLTPALPTLGTHATASNANAWVTEALPADYFANGGTVPVLTCELPGSTPLYARYPESRESAYFCQAYFLVTWGFC